MNLRRIQTIGMFLFKDREEERARDQVRTREALLTVVERVHEAVELQNKLDLKSLELEGRAHEAVELQNKLDLKSLELKERDISLRQAEANCKAKEDELARMQAKDDELARLQRHVDMSSQAEASTKQDVDRLSSELCATKASVAKIEQERQRLLNEVANASSSAKDADAVKTRLAALKKERDVLDAKKRALASKLAAKESEVTRLCSEVETLREETHQLAVDRDRHKQRFNSLAEDLITARQMLATAQEKSAAAQKAKQDVETTLRLVCQVDEGVKKAAKDVDTYFNQHTKRKTSGMFMQIVRRMVRQTHSLIVSGELDMTVSSQIRMVAESYEKLFEKLNHPSGRTCVNGLPWTKDHVSAAVAHWYDHRNKICHEEGFMDMVCHDKFAERSKYVFDLLSDLNDMINGRGDVERNMRIDIRERHNFKDYFK
jgi:chromosome segregation ATPase